MAAQSKTANKTAIDLQITTNGNNEITGADLNAILDNIVDSYEDFVGSYTTVQIAALAGMTLRQIVYDTDTKEYKFYDGTRWVCMAHPKYKVWTVLLSQTGTNAPTVQALLENSFGGTFVLSRESTGVYKATLTDAFLGTPFFGVCQSIVVATPFTWVKLSPSGSDFFYITTYDNSEALSDDILTDTMIEVRSYYS